MIIRICHKEARRASILITPDKKNEVFRSLGMVKHILNASRRDATSAFEVFADNHKRNTPNKDF